MNYEIREKYLKLALRLFGVIFLLIYPLGLVWPAGWIWHGGEGMYYLQMICGIYFVLGIYLIRAASNPSAHLVGPSQSDLVHRLVQRCPWGHHGCTGLWRSPRNRAPAGRRARVTPGGHRSRRAIARSRQASGRLKLANICLLRGPVRRSAVITALLTPRISVSCPASHNPAMRRNVGFFLCSGFRFWPIAAARS